MTALDDLRNVEIALDSALTGWIGHKFQQTTKLGTKCLEMVLEMRARRYKQWGENCAIRARMVRAESDLEGVRDTNTWLTWQLENSEKKFDSAKQVILDLKQKISDLETRFAEITARTHMC